MINRIIGWLGLRRQKGIQNSAPYNGYRTGAGSSVTFDSAMTVSAFWASVRLITETIASLPLKCYRIDDNGARVPDTEYRVWRLLQYGPNRFQTRVEFFESLLLELCTDGNFYGAVEFNARGVPVSIIPLMSAQMTPEMGADGDMIYTYYTSEGNVRVYSSRSIWHVKLFGNGVIGMSPMSYAARSLGTAIDLERRAAKLSASGGKTNGILMVDSKLNPDQRAAIRRNFAELTEGSEDQLFVLEANMKFERTSLSPVDMQLLESRKFQVEDIARFMGVPSVLINDTSGTTAWGSGIHQIIQGFYKLGLTPYTVRLQASIQRTLMPLADRDTYVIEFDFDALLQADFASRMDSYNKGVNGGVISPNEARGREGLPPKPGGDKIYLNGTLVPAGTVPLRGPANAPQATDS